MQSALRNVVRGFRSNPALSANSLRQLYEANPPAFTAASLDVIKDNLYAPGLRYVLTLLLSNGVLLNWLCDHELFTLEQATRIVSILRKVDTRIDIRLISAACSHSDANSETFLDEPSILRILDVTNRVSTDIRSLPIVAQLLRHNSPKVRSKAALILGRGNRNAKWVSKLLSEPDPRLRANAVESLWDTRSEAARAVFQLALGDSHNRVVGNAMFGLYKMGDPESIPLLLQLAAHPDAAFRQTAVWVMKQTRDPRFIEPLVAMISNPPKLRARILRTAASLRRAWEARTRSLQILVDEFELDAGRGLAKLRIAIRNERGRRAGLMPTHFIVRCDSELVHEYEVRSIAAPAPTAMALLIPCALDSGSQDLVPDALGKALHHRRNFDAWTLVRYSATDGAERVGNAFEPEICFSTVNQRIAALAGGNTQDIAPPVSSVIRAAIRAMPSNRRSKDICLILGESTADIAGADLEELARLAQEHEVRVHVIAFEPSESGRRLAQGSSGRYIGECRTETFAAVLETFVAVLTGGWELSFPCKAVPASILIQVFNEELRGENTYEPADRIG